MNGRFESSSDVDALFKLPLAEFTAARNALAAQLKKAGRAAEADEVKAVAKPSVSAWVVNQLYWRHRELFDRLIAAGDGLRRAQISQPANDSGRKPAIARREAVAALEKAAAELLRDGEHGGARDLLRRVTSTLEALSSYGSQAGAPIAGRLTDDLQPPGFEAAASLFADGDERPANEGRRHAHSFHKGATTHVRREERTDRRDEKERRGRVAAAKAVVQEAERALSVARKQAQRATAQLDTATTRANSMKEQRAQLEKRFLQAAKDADEALRHESEAAAKARVATQAAEAAERTLQLARRELQKVEGSQP